MLFGAKLGAANPRRVTDKRMKSLMIELRHVNTYGLPDWDLRDYRNQWLNILDMPQNRLQWCRCIHFLSFLRSQISKFINLYFLESYLRCLIFFITTNIVTTHTNMGSV